MSDEGGVAEAVHNDARLRALRMCGLFDGPADEAFDRLTRLVCRLLGVPTALVSLVEHDRQFFCSFAGLREPWASRRETPLSHSFCQHVVARRAPLIVTDAREDAVLRDNLAVPDLGMIAYLGVPLFTPDGSTIGSLCAIDGEPRAWSAEDLAGISEVANLAINEIALRYAENSKRALEADLHDREAFAIALLESSPDCIAALDLAGRVQLINGPGLAALEIDDVDPLIGTPWSLLWPEAERWRVEEALAAARAGEASRFEAPSPTARGTLKYWDVKVAPVFASGGEVDGIVAVSADMTGQVRAAAALRASGARLELALEGTDAGLWDCAIATGEAWYSDRWQTMLGYTPGEIANVVSAWSDLIHPEDARAVRKVLDAHLSGEIPYYETEQRLRHKDGSWLWVLSRGKIVERDAEGRPMRMAGTHIDIHARKEVQAELAEATDRSRQAAERALAEREFELALLAEHSTDGVFRLALDGTILYASPSMAELLGAPRERLVGANVLARFHPDDAATVTAEFGTLAAGDCERLVLRFRSAPMDGRAEWVWLEANCGLIRDHLGRPKEIVASTRDVSDRKALEQALQVARDEAEAASAAKSRFLANMSHEIRTPMNAVIGFTDLLLASELDKKQRRHARLIADSGKGMMRLLNDILDLSKIDAGQMLISPSAIDPRVALRAPVNLMHPLAASKRLSLEINFHPAIPAAIFGDALRLRQVMTNLLGNALKFTEAGGVLVRVRPSSDQPDALMIEVVDTGPGIAPDRLPHLFTEFVQENAGISDRYGGTGLGLAISRRLARLMGGDIAVDSVFGSGATFRFTFAAPPAEAESIVEAATPDAPAPIDDVGRVLLAEDHDINQELMLDLFASMGIGADIAENGAQAVDMVQQAADRGDPYRIVFMDMQMPVMGGLEATRLLRQRGYDPAELPIVALTANAYADDVAACLAAGMQDHLSKPLNSADLQAALGKWCHAEVEAPVLKLAVEKKPGLLERFEVRRQEAMAAVETLIDTDPVTPEAIEIAIDHLHKLAGTAGMFGYAALGDHASALENGLRSWHEGEVAERTRAMLELMREAA